jgi:hypothetical protein
MNAFIFDRIFLNKMGKNNNKLDHTQQVYGLQKTPFSFS